MGIVALVVIPSPVLQNIGLDFVGREVRNISKKCEGIKEGGIKMDRIPWGINNGNNRGFGLSLGRKFTPADISLAERSVDEFFVTLIKY